MMTNACNLLSREGVTLRAPEPEDLEVMFRLENLTDAWHASNITGPYSRFHLKAYLENTQNDLFTDRQLRLMVMLADGQVVGEIDLFAFEPMHRRAEVGILIDPDFQRQGIGRTALSILCDYSFHYLGIHQLYAYVAVDNRPSRALFASCGFTEAALLHDWVHSAGGGFADVYLVSLCEPSSRH